MTIRTLSEFGARMLACAAISMIAACATEDSVSQEEADTIWQLSNELIHEFHLDELLQASEPLEESYTYPCPDGGTVDMTVVFDAGEDRSPESIADLLHTFDGCSLQGTIFNGPFDYLDIKGCSGRGFDFEIEGELALSGDIEATCQIIGAERCDTLTGMVCGRGVEFSW